MLNNPPEKWDGGVGFVNTAMIKERLPAPAPDAKILLCGTRLRASVYGYELTRFPATPGPPPMMTAMKKSLAELVFDAPRTVSKIDDQVFLF